MYRPAPGTPPESPRWRIAELMTAVAAMQDELLDLRGVAGADVHPAAAALVAAGGDPVAQAAAVVRWLAGWAVGNEWRTSPLMLADNLANLVDEIDPQEVARG